MNINNFQIELVEGCTRRCDFCGIHSILGKVKEPNFMELELAEYIAFQINEQFKEKIRIEFAVHGEPLLHPNINEIIKLFRDIIPKSQLSIISNGDPLLNKVSVKGLFDSGLNFLMVDFYENNEKRDSKIYENIISAVESGDGIRLSDFYKDGSSIWGYKSNKIKEVIVVDPLSIRSGEKLTRKIHTAAGNVKEGVWVKYGLDKIVLPKLTRCAKPFREMSINYNGNVSICCEDWKQESSISNVMDEKIIDIWNGELFNKYRYLLYNKRRDLIPLCSKCNQVSFRVGFLKIDKEFKGLIK